MSHTRPDAYMPMFWGDYLRDTGHLGAVEHGGYLLLIGHYWTSGKPLPDNDVMLARIARMTPDEWKQARPILEAFFQVTDGVWRHRRVEAELAKATDRGMKAQRAAAKRWKGETTPESDHDPGGHEDKTAKSPTQEAPKETRKSPRAKSEKHLLPSDFEPDPESIRECERLKINPDELMREVRDWARAKKPMYADWQAAFRNSARRTAEYRAKNAARRSDRPGPTSVVDAALRAREARDQAYLL